jgi:membrane associated rhomboid family serine protease
MQCRSGLALPAKQQSRRPLAAYCRTAYCCLLLPGALVNRTSEPIFNVPGVVLAIIGICALVLAGEAFLLTPEADGLFLRTFGFVPARYDSSLLSLLPPGALPGGTGADIWTFLTYAFIHGDVTHLGMNAVWFLPFGSAVARRFGNLRALGFFAATAAAGALMHLVTHWGEVVPMIGASAAVSGFMAGAIRFAFQNDGPVTMFRPEDPAAYLVPAAPLSSALRDPRIVVFLLTWFGLNLVFGIIGVGTPGAEQNVAWQAHIGGFLAGLLLFPLFDPVPARAT